MRIKYRLEYHPNPNCVTIHVDEQVPFRGGTQMAFGDTIDDRLLRIDAVCGVESCSSYAKYDIGIVKGAAFNWADVLPSVIQAVGDVLGGDMADDGITGKFLPRDRHKGQVAEDAIEGSDWEVGR